MADKGVLNTLIVDPLESGFDAIGLGEGEFAPLGRAVVGGAIGYGIVIAFKPAVAYDEAGKERPFSIDGSNNGTLFPWWMFVAVPAIISSVLI
jgi:hypothetical protein